MTKLTIGGITLAVALSITAIVVSVMGGSSVADKFGAVSSPDIPSPYFSYGDIRFWGAKTTSLTSATTTVCSLQSPAATSSLVTAAVRLTTSSTTASTVTLAKATTPYATTTSLGAISVSANGQGVAVASTTGSHIFAPNTYFVVGMQGNTGTFSPVGVCQATWMEIQ